MTHPTAVLFVHGIQGSPGQFQFLIDALPPGTEVRNLLLPGHGAGAKEFRRSGRESWLSALRAETEALLSAGKRVVYVGHSMGCLLGLLASRALGDPFAGMLLLCCPFSFRLNRRYISIGYRAARPERPGEDLAVTATRAANSVRLRRTAEQLTLIHPYAELLRLMAQVRRLKPRGPAGIRFFFSGDDEIVSSRCRETAAAWPAAEVRILPGCSHNYYPEEARQTLGAALLSVLNEVST